MEGDEAHYTAFHLSTPSLQAAACSIQPFFKTLHAPIVFCILQFTMAMGRLLRDFIDPDARGFTPSLRQDLHVLLSDRHIGWSVYGAASLDREEAAKFFLGMAGYC